MTGIFTRSILPFAAAAAVATLALGCSKPAPVENIENIESSEHLDTAAAAPADSHADHDHAEHDHAGHDHAGHDHDHDHAGHDHDHDHAGHDHAGHDHGAHEDGDIMDLILAEGSFDPSAVVRQPGASLGDITRCPVSGEAFTITDAHPHVTHEGEEVYFCCPGCIRRFQRNAQRYLDEQP